jgi:hypothetical protein
LAAAVAAMFTLVAMAGFATVTDTDEAAAAGWIYHAGQTGYFELGQVRATKIYSAEYGGYLTALTVDGPTVWATGNAQTELVTIYTQLYQWTTQGWLQVGWNRYDQGVIWDRYGPYRANPATFNSVGAGFYWIQQFITWSGTNGWAGVAYNQPRDFVCNSNTSVYSHCTPYYEGYFYVHFAHPWL